MIEQNVTELSKEELEKKIEVLTTRKNELKGLLTRAKLNTIDNIKYNSIATLYASVCGLIVDYKTALVTLGIFGAGTIIECITNYAKITKLESEKEDVVDRLIGNSLMLAQKQ